MRIAKTSSGSSCKDAPADGGGRCSEEDGRVPPEMMWAYQIDTDLDWSWEPERPRPRLRPSSQLRRRLAREQAKKNSAAARAARPPAVRQPQGRARARARRRRRSSSSRRSARSDGSGSGPARAGTYTQHELEELTERARQLNAGRALGPNENILAGNGKCGLSFDLPVCETCCPSSVCLKICYGRQRSKYYARVKTIARQLRVLAFVLASPPRAVAERIGRECTKARTTFVRINGVGDLIPQTVAMVNLLVELRPALSVWVVTRRVDLAAQLRRDAENLFIQVSLDASPQSKTIRDRVAALGHPRMYPSYVRTDAAEDTFGAAVVFNEQGNATLPTHDLPTLCPADAGVVPFQGACEKCRKCFSPAVLAAGQTVALPDGTPVTPRKQLAEADGIRAGELSDAERNFLRYMAKMAVKLWREKNLKASDEEEASTR
jgi:hypothetical protein